MKREHVNAHLARLVGSEMALEKHVTLQKVIDRATCMQKETLLDANKEFNIRYPHLTANKKADFDEEAQLRRKPPKKELVLPPDHESAVRIEKLDKEVQAQDSKLKRIKKARAQEYKAAAALFPDCVKRIEIDEKVNMVFAVHL